jgi:ribose/xylose/arabinose/galactoside ABC-type transport system permease subunit
MKDEPSEPTAPRAKQADASKGQEANAAILAQYHAAEYSVLMGRVSSWESLQYAAWPILLGALALLAQMEDIDVNYRWWAALISSLLVYVAYQGTMVNMLFYVLLVERDLRPIAGLLIDHENFWVHERIRQNGFPPNPAWATKWPMLISLAIIVGVAEGVIYVYGTHWYDVVCLIVSLVLLSFVARLTKNGERLKGQIRAACTPEVEHAGRTGSDEAHALATGAEVNKKEQSGTHNTGHQAGG